jgi:ABC-type polysaccharide/polyol phosphate export permease
MNATPAIETRALRKSYGDVVALGGVDLSVGPGIVFGLLGRYGFTIIFPLTFISSAFVPIESMPGWLRPIAEANPVTFMVGAVRALFIGTPAGNSIWGTLVWCAVIVGVFAPLSAWRYRRAVTR